MRGVAVGCESDLPCVRGAAARAVCVLSEYSSVTRVCVSRLSRLAARHSARAARARDIRERFHLPFAASRVLKADISSLGFGLGQPGIQAKRGAGRDAHTGGCELSLQREANEKDQL